MNLEARKIEFIQEFLKLQSEEVISQLESILQKEIKSHNNEKFKPMSMEEYDVRIDESIRDSENGRLIKADGLKAKMEGWL